MADADQPTLEPDVTPVEIQEEVERSFLDYAMSVIVSRALPDARDGLKPVHRRILYGMYERGLRPDRAYTKCAQVVGHVMGNYHPHGDQAIYDALARMTQDFSLRHPLVDGHGNFGSPDPNDRPAAYRYCVVGETRVRTTHGTVRIDDLAPVEPESEVDIERKVLDREGEPVLATKLFHSGAHPTVRLRTTEGFELTGTRNHPVLCLVDLAGVPTPQWRLLGEVEPGDRVMISRAQPEEHLWASEQELDLATLLGAWVAEGFASESRAGFNNVDRRYFDRVLDAYDKVVGGPRDVYRRTLPSGKTIHELDVQRLGAFSASPLAELAGLRSDRKRVPELVWRAPLEAKRAFLQALFEGDGSCSKLPRNSLHVAYSTRSDPLARDVQVLLLEFGVVAHLHRYENGERKLSISNRRDARLFAHRVGFWGAEQRKLEAILAEPPTTRSSSATDRTPLFTSGWYHATVESVTDAGVQPVYSIRVDSHDHSFLADGFVNHNTECRLDHVAMQMLADIDEETVDFVDTYDGKTQEPVVLPSRLPNLLVNGGGGIAVGMATNIPPHNLGEVIDATVHLLDNPDASVEDLMRHVQGPDFPTGALILGQQGIHDMCATGRGSIKMRAVTEVDEGPKGQRIVVSEVPYQTSVEGIGAKIAELVADRKIEGIRDVRNETSRGEYRLVVDLKRDANAQVVLNQLYKQTPMQASFGVIVLALIDGIPRVLDLRDALGHYVDHQVDVVTRRTRFRLGKAKDRAHIVEGLLRALDAIDEIIALIRGSEDTDAARAALMAEPFEFTEVQAGHILDMPLRRLAQLEHQKLKDEHEELAATIKELESILRSKKKLRGVIKDELGDVRERFATERRTRITLDSGDLDTLDLIEDEEVVMVLSYKGYVKTVNVDSFRRQGRGGRGVRGGTLRDEDFVEHLLMTTAHSYLLFFSNRGRVYRIRAHEIPLKERTARGTALVNLLALQPDEHIEAVIDTRTYEDGAYLFFATKNGMVKKTKMSEYDSSLRTGLIAINLKDDDELVRVVQTSGDNDILLVSANGMTIRFSESDVRPMGRATAGVRGMKLRNADDAVVGATVARDDAVMLFVSSSGHGKRTKLDRFRPQGRGGQGVRGMKLTASRGKVVGAFTVGSETEILVFSSGGNIIRMGANEISSQGRDATGVRVARLGGGEHVVAVAPVLETESDAR